MSKNSIKLISLTVLLLILSYFICNIFINKTLIQQNNYEKTTYVDKIINKEKLTEEQLKLLTDFFDTYYSSIKDLKPYNMTMYFENPNSNDALINQMAISYLVENRKLKRNDLTLDTAKYDLNITDIVINEEQISIKVLEDSYVRFNFMKDIESITYNIENNFTIKKVNNKYKIINYNKVQDFYVMIKEDYTIGGINQLYKIKNKYIYLVKQNLSKDDMHYQDYLNNEPLKIKICDNEYDRKKALEYATKWVNKRNAEYKTFNANCQNFASQVIHTGGVIMDFEGDAKKHLQWKFYDEKYNEKQTNLGYVYTWTYVPYFYEYAKENKEVGLCADVDVNMYYAEAGDIIHVGPKEPTRHAVVVVKPYEKDNKVIDILVNSNTIDLENYPISAYAYPYSTLIKIYGWNNEKNLE